MPGKLTLQDCIDAANKEDGYCYAVEYLNTRVKMPWGCKRGHQWETTFDHIRGGSWCAKCWIIDNKQANVGTIEEVFAFVKLKGWKCHTKEYKNNSQLLSLECELGHQWEAPFRRIKNQKTECPYCEKKHQFTIDEIKKMAIKEGNKIICLTTTIKKSREQMEWKCVEYDHSFNLPLFRIIDNNFSCSICSKENKIKYTWQNVLDASEKTHLTLLAHPKIDEKIYNTKNIGNQWAFKCICNKIIYPNIGNVLAGRNKSCGCIKSSAQRDIFTFVHNLGVEAVENDNSIIRSDKKSLELDIFIPEKNIAIEYCGLYWHGERQNGQVAKNKHANKLKLCQDKKIRLITIFEDEWLLKPEQTKGYLKAILGKAEIKIDARKCEIKTIKSKYARVFHNANHIQGSANGKSIALYFNNELVCIATFAKPSASRNAFKDNNDKIELMRYTVKINHNVRGGLGKLLSNFIKNNTNIKEIVSYSDNRWSNGNIYKALGFEKDNIGTPSYFYFENGKLERKHRYNFTKHRALKIFGGNAATETEWDIMKRNNYDRIWDCGSSKWSLKLNNETKKK